MFRRRSFWVYSVGLAVVWAIVLVIVSIVKANMFGEVLLVFGGFFIGWVSTTIARYVYPPPKRWNVQPPHAVPGGLGR